MKIVTSGNSFLDIDGYACSVAYAELLRAQGEEAIAASSAPLNESIPATARSWRVPFTTTYTPKSNDQFVLVDLSDPEWLDPIVSLDRIIEVIDHRTNFVAYWQTRPEVKVQIEVVGAACTQIYERWKAAGLLHLLSVPSARLLVCGILDNTLNFKAKITTDRDHAAHADLLKRADLPADWTTRYFSECQHGIENNLDVALQNDLKRFQGQAKLPEYIGQLVIWDASELLKARVGEIMTFMNRVSADWAVNIISINDGHSYFLAQDEDTQAKLRSLLGLTFKGDIAKADRLWLRKEVLKKVGNINRTGLRI